jgi:hypothetical protein
MQNVPFSQMRVIGQNTEVVPKQHGSNEIDNESEIQKKDTDKED